MSEPDTTSATTGAAPPPAWVTNLAQSLLMSLGAGVIAQGVVTNAQWIQIVGGLVAALSALWTWVERHPSRADPIAALRGLIAASGAANVAAFDGALTQAEAAILIQALPVLNKLIAAHVPKLIRAPVENVADQGARAAADQMAGHLKV